MANQAVIDDITETVRTNSVGIAGFTILIWDHLDTFPTEVEYIWKPKKKGPIVYLFLLNRYLTPLGFIVNLFAYFSPVWTPEVCSHFIRFEGAMTIIGIHIAASMMLLRIHALYSSKRIVVGCVLSLFLVMFGMNAWLLTQGEPCTMIFPPNISALASSSAWLPLLYDSVVLVLTLLKTVPLVRKNWGSLTGHLPWKRLVEDGLLYYTFEKYRSSARASVQMMSRITLNLKKFGHQGSQDSLVRDTGPIVFYPASARVRAEINLQNSRTAYRAPEIGV
ncbi:hypothetical protein B0H13DRAFT_2276069 [Mycena leptocephala]|nr:hypothetical protein B0H13DRAFT_2276069 [Mycena leptocephala]